MKNAKEYVEQVLRALSPPGIEHLNKEEYIEALEEIEDDISAMLEAAREELANEREETDDV